MQVRVSGSMNVSNSTYYPDLLQTAMFLGEKCTDAEDLRRFKDYKRGKRGISLDDK